VELNPDREASRCPTRSGYSTPTPDRSSAGTQNARPKIAEQLACSASVVYVPLLDVVAADLSHGPHVGAVEQSTGKETQRVVG
jgi:hypothetical protein